MFTCDPEKHSISNPNHPQHQHTQPRRHRLIHIYKYNQLRIVWTFNTIFYGQFSYTSNHHDTFVNKCDKDSNTCSFCNAMEYWKLEF